MDYNQFTYYRANPYAKQGYMPPTAFLNRHKPQFLTQLPMGQQHLTKGGKKQYGNNIYKSNIETDDILKSPQRYPYENRIALDKQYQRNLNTIDIEGASGGTLLSQAVRNKMKARQLLTRKQQLENFGQNQSVQKDLNEQQKRRKVAYTQFLRDQQLKQIQLTQRNPQNNNYSRQFIPQINKNNMISQQNNKQYYIPKETNRRQQQQQYNDNQHLYPRYQSIDVSKTRQKQQNEMQQKVYQNSRDYLQNLSIRVDASHRRFKHPIYQDIPKNDIQDSQKQQSNLNAYNQYKNLAKDKKSLRYQNPTNLSSEGSIHLAARNIIKGQ